jgi:hypothetical protein
MSVPIVLIAVEEGSDAPISALPRWQAVEFGLLML